MSHSGTEQPLFAAIDLHVAARLRDLRIMLGLTQEQMAKLIGVTYQQAQKYETGANRVSAGRLYRIAQALGVEVDYFFAGLSSGESAPQHRRARLLLELA